MHRYTMTTSHIPPPSLMEDPQQQTILQFQVVKVDGTPYHASHLLCPTSSVFNPRARLVEAEGASVLSLSCVQAVCMHDEAFAYHHPKSRANATKRIVYAGATGLVEGVLFITGAFTSAGRDRLQAHLNNDGVVHRAGVSSGLKSWSHPTSGASLWSIRDRRKTLELQHLRSLHDHIISIANVNAAAKATFQLAAASSSKTSGTTATAFCSMLDDIYAQATAIATAAVEEATSADAVANLEQVHANIAHTKTAFFARIVENFPDAAPVMAAAKVANIPVADTDVVVMAFCFDILERGLRANALTRGPTGPECPVCYEDLDMTSENLSRSLIILECLLPKDYAHGPIHHLCRGCWSKISREAVKHGEAPKCPNCRVVTVGRTLSQCAYGVMTELMLP